MAGATEAWKKKALLRRIFSPYQKGEYMPMIPDPLVQMSSLSPLIDLFGTTKLVRRYPGKIQDIEDVRPIVQDLMKRMRVKGIPEVTEIPRWKLGFGSHRSLGGGRAHIIGVKMKPSWILDKSQLDPAVINRIRRSFGFYYQPKWRRLPRGTIEDTALHEVLHARFPKLIEKILPYKTKSGRAFQEGMTEALTKALKKWAFLKRVPR